MPLNRDNLDQTLKLLRKLVKAERAQRFFPAPEEKEKVRKIFRKANAERGEREERENVRHLAESGLGRNLILMLLNRIPHPASRARLEPLVFAAWEEHVAAVLQLGQPGHPERLRDLPALRSRLESHGLRRPEAEYFADVLDQAQRRMRPRAARKQVKPASES